MCAGVAQPERVPDLSHIENTQVRLYHALDEAAAATRELIRDMQAIDKYRSLLMGTLYHSQDVCVEIFKGIDSLAKWSVPTK